MKSQLLKEEFFRAGPLQQLLLRHTQALRTQIAQTAVGNCHHSLDQQLCRWLLLSLDRAGLERRICECYAVVRKEYERLLPEVLRQRPVADASASMRPDDCLDEEAMSRG